MVAKGIVAELDWSELMTDNGTAVGLVASNEKVATGVDTTEAPLTAGVEAAGGVAAGGDAAGGDAAGGDAAGTDAAGADEAADDEAARTGAAGGA